MNVTLDGIIFEYILISYIYRLIYNNNVNVFTISVIIHIEMNLIPYAATGAKVTQWVRSLDLTVHTSLLSIRRGFAPSFVNYKKVYTRLAAASDKVYQLHTQGRWFSPGTPASSTTKAGRHDIAEILLKVALKHQNFNQSTLCNIHPVSHTLLSCQKYTLTFVL